MGAYNTLHADVACSKCSAVAEREIQFKYADKWLHDYRLGETLRWGGNDAGVPGKARVRVQGYAANACPNCGQDDEYFSIIVERDVITEVQAVAFEDLNIPSSESFIVESD